VLHQKVMLINLLLHWYLFLYQVKYSQKDSKYNEVELTIYIAFAYKEQIVHRLPFCCTWTVWPEQLFELYSKFHKLTFRSLCIRKGTAGFDHESATRSVVPVHRLERESMKLCTFLHIYLVLFLLNAKKVYIFFRYSRYLHID